eukprot:GHVP01061413.1.p1 GENE.GHVP01061413.1~~GHVP01061413.1.p1  ORF type:complete len:1049 (+),score=285.52 GHVP01061413.1:78-3224(+)
MLSPPTSKKYSMETSDSFSQSGSTPEKKKKNKWNMKFPAKSKGSEKKKIKAENEQLQNRVANAQQEVDDVQTIIQLKNDAIENLRAEIEAADLRVLDIEQQLKQAQKNCEEATARAERAVEGNQEIKSIMDQVKSLQREKHVLERANEDLEEKLKLSEVASRNASRSNKDLQEALAKCHDLETMLEKERTALEKAKQELLSLEKENADILENLNQANSLISTLQSSNTQEQDEAMREELNRIIDQQSKKLTDATNELISYETQIVALQEEVNQAKINSKQKEAKSPQVEHMHESAETALRNEIDHLKNELSNIESQLVNVEERSIKDLEETTESYEQQIRDLKNQLEETKSINTGTPVEILQLKNNLADLRKENEGLRNDLKKTKLTEKDHEKQVGSLTRNSSALQHQLNVLLEKNSDLEKRQEILSNSQREETDLFTTEIEELKNKNKDLSDIVQELRREIAESEECVVRQKRDILGLTSQIKKLQEEKANNLYAQDSTIEDLNSKIQKLQKKFVDEKSDMEAEMQKIEQQKDKEINSLKKEISQQQTSGLELENMLISEKEKRRSAQIAADQATDEFTSQITALKREISTLKFSAGSDNQKLESRFLKELEEKTQILEDSNRKLQVEIKKIEWEKEQTEKEKSRYEKETKKIRGEFEDMTRESKMTIASLQQTIDNQSRMIHSGKMQDTDDLTGGGAPPFEVPLNQETNELRQRMLEASLKYSDKDFIELPGSTKYPKVQVLCQVLVSWATAPRSVEVAKIDGKSTTSKKPEEVVTLLKTRLINAIFDQPATWSKHGMQTSLKGHFEEFGGLVNIPAMGKPPQVAILLQRIQRLWDLSEDLRLSMVQSDPGLTGLFNQTRTSADDWRTVLEMLRGSTKLLENRNDKLETAYRSEKFAVQEARNLAQLERERARALEIELRRIRKSADNSMGRLDEERTALTDEVIKLRNALSLVKAESMPMHRRLQAAPAVDLDTSWTLNEDSPQRYEAEEVKFIHKPIEISNHSYIPHDLTESKKEAKTTSRYLALKDDSQMSGTFPRVKKSPIA